MFPETRRIFQVTRCNHCEDAPCVEICPTTALFKRKDGIVDFDGGRCIGCKACMQGCPYDALYIDPQTETAAKCNFCAHKVEVGLEPPCVTVCPTQAIVAGDLARPREPDRADGGAHPDPGAQAREGDAAQGLLRRRRRGRARARRRAPAGVVHVGERAPGRGPHRGDGRGHRRPPPHLRREGAAPELVGLEGVRVPVDEVDRRRRVPRPRRGWRCSIPWPTAPPLAAVLVATLALAATGVLLVWDLRQPRRFLWTLTRPQWRSWLTRGSYVIAAYGVLLGVHLAGRGGARGDPADGHRRSPSSSPRGRPSTPRSSSASPRGATSGSRRCWRRTSSCRR